LPACRSDKFLEGSVDFFENVRCAREEVEEVVVVVVVVVVVERGGGCGGGNCRATHPHGGAARVRKKFTTELKH
jgi:hypothetical protein